MEHVHKLALAYDAVVQIASAEPRALRTPTATIEPWKRCKSRLPVSGATHVR